MAEAGAPDPRPEPRYGQYAPLPPANQTPVAPDKKDWPAPEPATKAPVNRTRDIAITTVLLLVGVFDVVTTFKTFGDLGPSISVIYEQLGIAGTASAALAAPFGLAINIVRVSVLAITIVVSLLLIARQRRAFWVPLAGYAVAGIVSSILVCIVMLNDPAYQAWLTQNQ